MKHLRNIALAVASVGLLVLAPLSGCKPKPAVERQEIEMQSDEKLAQQVKAALENSASFKFPDVQVTAFKATVQLSGFVMTEDQKRSAGEIAKSIPGVTEVENQIALKH